MIFRNRARAHTWTKGRICLELFGSFFPAKWDVCVKYFLYLVITVLIFLQTKWYKIRSSFCKTVDFGSTMCQIGQKNQNPDMSRPVQWLSRSSGPVQEEKSCLTKFYFSFVFQKLVFLLPDLYTLLFSPTICTGPYTPALGLGVICKQGK